MVRTFITGLLLLVSLSGFCETPIDPISFEHIWLQNNQRNLFTRYREYNDQVQATSEGVYLLGFDAAPDKKILTSEGEKNALISRMNIHYQDKKYLLLIDWFSAIPQPQETEGFTYGDLILGYTFRRDASDSYLTLGLRQKSTPRSVVVNSQVVFNATSDATREDYSVFVHAHYHDYDVGTYFSKNNELDAMSFDIPIAKNDRHSLTSTVSYFNENPDANLYKRYELSIENTSRLGEQIVRAGAVAASVPDLNKNNISNVFAEYTSSGLLRLKFIGGLYYYNDIENNDRLNGGKIGLLWKPEQEAFQLGFSLQRNAIGDFNALIVRNEPVFSFKLTTWGDGIFGR